MITKESNLFIPYPDVMSQEELNALQLMKQRQQDKLNSTSKQTEETFSAKHEPFNTSSLADKLITEVPKLKKTIETLKTKEEKKMKQISPEAKLVPKPKDQFGNLIEAGDYITYPCRRGSSMWMETGKVMSVTSIENYLNEEEVVVKIIGARNKKVTLYRHDRSIVLPKSYIQNNNSYKDLMKN
jgi:hypothetical protein